MISSIFKKLFKPAQQAPRGLVFGDATSGQVLLDDATLRSHVAVVGGRGRERSTLIEQLLTQQTAKGGGWIHVDPSADEDLRDRLAAAATAAGRAQDFYVLDLARPENSNTYDVLRSGSVDTRVQRILTPFPKPESDKEARYVKELTDFLGLLFPALDATGKSVSLRELANLLHSLRTPAVREKLLSDIPTDHPAHAALDLALAVLALDSAAAATNKPIGGRAAMRLQQLAGLDCAAVVCHPYPEIDFSDVLSKGKMCYISLPRMGKDQDALELTKMVVQDICTSLFARAALPADQRQPFLVAMDSFPTYGMLDTLSPAVPDATYAQARAMNVALLPFVDSRKWDQVSTNFRTEALTGNTFTKVYFQQEESRLLALQYPKLPANVFSALAPGRFLVCQGSRVVEGKLRYTDTGTPPGFERRPMPGVESRARWQAPTLQAAP
jgi:hypothetical protein